MSMSLEERDAVGVDEAEQADVTSVEIIAPDGVLVPPEALVRQRLRRKGARKHTESMRRLSKREFARGAEEFPASDVYTRPVTRGDCIDGERPCPFLACRHHLALDIHPQRGSITINKPDVPIEEMVETCALDVADRGPVTLEEIGEIMNITRERVRQIEERALAKAKYRAPLVGADPELLR